MKNILILTYWSYKDALIQTYTLPYVKVIRKQLPLESKIFLLTIEQNRFKMTKREWILEKEKLAKENIYLIRFQYNHFGVKMGLRLIALLYSLFQLIKKENISFIHAWCTPAGALGYLLSILTRKPLIIDSYEPHAESMVENGTWGKSGFKFKLLFWLEKKQSHRAKTVIALTKGMKEYAQQKYNATFNNYYIKPALVDLNQFNHEEELYVRLRKEKQLTDKIVCVYAGKLGGIYLEKEVFDFFKTASNFWGDRLKIFLLTDKNKEEIDDLIQQKEIPKECIEAKFVNHEEIQDYYQLADFAINPVKPVPSKRYCTSIKDGEYWAMGLPVVITKNISDDSEIIQQENIGYVLQKLTNEEYLKACKKINSMLKGDRNKLSKSISFIAHKYRGYHIANIIYKEIYS
ncbi:MAG: glycosyltransferase [Flavobacteriales bacterium]|nr:glycosyltransferase [Flavobacteriales bacterium]NQX96289.1 glycosyltransferase [Flavobacteriales bacterium]